MKSSFFQKINKFPYGLALGIISVGVFISFTNSYNDRSNFFALPQIISPMKLNRDFSFAGEPVLLNEDTKERLDRELMVNAYYHSSTLMGIKKMTRFFPVIEKILQEEGIPDDFKYLAVAESNLMNATSSSNAKGYWQFMKGTSQDEGLEISDYVDERNHLELSTRAAARYIKKLYQKFGSWTAAAAAYNVGPNKLQQVMNEQKTNNYYDLHLNQETLRYVFRIVAIKDILIYPEEYGFLVHPEELYGPLDRVHTLKVDTTIKSLIDFAHHHGTTYRMLKYYNPWLISDALPNKGKTYEIKIPK